MLMQSKVVLLIITMHCVNGLTVYLTLGRNKTYVSDLGTEILTFGSSWEIGSGETPAIGGLLDSLLSTNETKLYVENTMIKKLSYKVKALAGSEKSKISTTFYFAAIDISNKLRCYETYNLNEKNLGINHPITNVKIYENLAIAFHRSNGFVAIVNLYPGGLSSSSKNIGGYEIYDGCVTSGYSILYVAKKSSNSHHIFFYVGSTITSAVPDKSIDLIVPTNPTLTERIFYQESTALFIRISSTYIELYNASTNILTSNFSISQGTLTSAVLCNQFIVYSVLNIVYFYDAETFTLKGQISSSTQPVSELKCFEEDLLVGASYNMYQSSVIGLLGGQKKFEVHYYSLKIDFIEEANTTEPISEEDSVNSTNETNLTNESNLTNETNETNETDPLPGSGPIEQPIPSPPTSPEPSIPSKEELLNPNNFEESFLSLLINEDFKYAIETSASIIGAFSFLTIGRNLIKPFLTILDNFWFYGFHVIEYPDIVEFFTNEVDLLNELRIKPDFLNFEVDVEKFNQQNSLYVDVLKIHDREPETVYTFQSLKNVYINNFVFSILSFFVLKIITKCMKHCCGSFVNPQNKITYQIYKYLSSTCYWWCLLVTCIESNISVLTFFSTIQLNMFSSFEIMDMVSLLTGLLFLFSTFFYSFFVKIFVFTFNSKSRTSELFGLGKHTQKGLALQMSINCIFPFLDALVHGIFLNRHSIQVVSLILLNLLEIAVMLKFRKEFLYKIDFVIFVVYKVIFFTFNVNIFLFSFYGDLQIPFNFIFTIIIVCLLFLTICKFFSGIGIMVYEKCKTKVKKMNEKGKDELLITENLNEAIKEQSFKVTFKDLEEINTASNVKTKETLYYSKKKIKKEKKTFGESLFVIKKKPNKVSFADHELDVYPSVQNINFLNQKELTSMKLIENSKKSFNIIEEKKKSVKFIDKSLKVVEQNSKSVKQIEENKKAIKMDENIKMDIFYSESPKSKLKRIELAYFADRKGLN